MVKIVFSKHAQFDKFKLLEKHGFKVSTKTVKEVVKTPEHEDRKSDFPKIIASKSLDDKHILRVVYRKERGIIKIITFYPAEKGRYY